MKTIALTPVNNQAISKPAPCNICGSNDFSIRYHPAKQITVSEEVFAAGHFLRGTQQIVQCKRCKLVYVNPQLENRFIQSSYENSPAEGYLSQASLRKMTFKHSLREIEKYAPRKGALLDVGCASGLFLQAAREQGWEVQGVEVCRWLIENAPPGCAPYIKVGTLKQANYPSESFDIVTLWDVLEHLTDPKAELHEIHRVLKKGGVLVINFPDIDSLSSKLTRQAWWHLVSVHLYYFSTKTLSSLLSQTGFSVIAHKKHLQILELGYLAQLLEMYFKPLGKLLITIINKINWQKLPITFSSGETNLIARKSDI